MVYNNLRNHTAKCTLKTRVQSAYLHQLYNKYLCVRYKSIDFNR